MNVRMILLSAGLLLTTSAVGQEMAGKTMVAKGDVMAQPDANQQARKLKRRAPIFDNDVVSTGDKSRAQIRMTDGGMLALKANSELVISDYQFSKGEGKGSVVMELVKGGLRSVTGTIKAESGDYKLKTPVGSIGIRGTHYEVEIVSGELFVAVWDGAIDMSIDVGAQAGDTVSFGDGEDYSFASIDAEGNVTELIEPPENFNSGMSAQGSAVDEGEDDEAEGDAEADSSDSAQGDDQQTEQEGDADSEESSEAAEQEEASEPESTEDSDTESETETEETAQVDSSSETESPAGQDENATTEPAITEAASPEATIDESLGADLEQTSLVETTAQQPVEQISDDIIEDESFIATDEFNAVEPATIEEQLAAKTGVLTYTNDDYAIESTAGGVGNFQMSMTVDFDTLGVSSGAMTFDDLEGEWRATFSGHISGNGQFDMDISHASHGDNLAQGDINAFFFGDLETITGDFNLAEVVNTSVTASGKFWLK